MPIDDLARSDVVTADRETAMADLAATMDDADVGCVVITDGETPVGVITADDLTELLADEEQKLAEIIRAQRPEY